MAGRWAVKRLAALAAAALAVASLAVVSGRSHDEEVQPEAPAGAAVGPGRNEPVAMPTRLVGLEIALGVGDPPRTEWGGEVSVSEGRVLGLDVVRSAPGATVRGARFTLETVKAAAKQKKQQAKKKQAAAAAALLHANLDAPATATVTVRTGHGSFSFRPSELAPGRRTPFLGGEAAVERVEAAVRITGRGTEDDFPAAAAAPDGTVWLAYVEYRPEEPRIVQTVRKSQFGSLVPTRHGDTVRLRRFDGTTWHPAVDVTGHGLDVWRPTVAVDGKGTVWVAWAQQVEGDWEVFRRGYTPPTRGVGEGTWSDPERVTKEAGSDFHVVATTDAKGLLWLAWQGYRDGNYEVLAAAPDAPAGHPWKAPKVVSNSRANDWSPAIAADDEGGVYVAWDTYDRGNYDVRACKLPGGRPFDVAGSARFEARASLARDRQGRVWVAYEDGDEQWGKDYAHAGDVRNVGQETNPGFALYVHRTVKVKCLAAGTVALPAGAEPTFGPIADRNKSVPRLAVGGDGTLWLLVRHHPLPGGAGEVWVSSALAFDGAKWSAPRRLSSSANLIDNRPALVPLGGDLLAVYSGDRRQNAQTRVEDDLYAARLAPAARPSEPQLLPDPETPRVPAARLPDVHPDESAAVAALRAYRVEAGGKTLRPLRGEFHRHTEVSSHNDQDGLLEDSWRYALDAASLDWMGNGDHDNGFGFEYLWWLIQKSADLHTNAPGFVGAQTYERSVVYPNGHRNVMMPRRGIRPLPRGDLQGTPEEGTPDTKLLYDYLKHFGGICASHTSATDMGTDWRDNDPAVEPVVEIYQGHRHNYEHLGAPRSPTPETQIGGYQPRGFVWNALGKGYRLGFQSSSDHVSTHWSYAVVFAEDAARAAIIDAFKKRHCYAATDNILLDVRSGEHFMGDAFTTTRAPTLSVNVRGTAPVARVHVIRDGRYALTVQPAVKEVKLSYTDDDAKPGESHYYYVRVEQSDGNLAWGSPVWVTYAK